MRKNRLSPAYVTWDGDQRASDGGIDVRISIPEDVEITGWVPDRNTVFQIKAEDLPPAKIRVEMFPGDVVRPALAELDQARGIYIIASSRASVADRRLRERKIVMRDCADQHELRTLGVDYYGRRALADWASEHKSLGPWVRALAGRSSEGWKSYGPWAYMETTSDAQFLDDPEVKAFIPGEEESVSALTAIGNMRQRLGQPGQCLRLIGLSGVGKTRLVQALFDDRVETDHPALNPDTVLYTDLGDEPSPAPNHMADQLIAENRRMVLVVDNCGADLHERLVKIVAADNSHLSLLTIEYDIRDDLSLETQAYRLEPASNELVSALVRRRYNYLSDNDVEHIIDFSGGNARVAIVLAGTAEQGGELAQLRNNELFDRLFSQRQGSSSELLASATAASLVYSFDGETSDVPDSELATLSELAGLTMLKMRNCLNDLGRRGLLQKRANWRALLPHAISNRLALRALDDVPQDMLWAKLACGSLRLARSFSRRLSYLHESPIAMALAVRWLSDGNGLTKVAALEGLSLDIFCNLAPLQPERALTLLEVAIGDEAFLSTRNFDRSRIAHLVRNIAYEPQYFERCVYILAAFVLKEDGNSSHVAVRSLLERLYQIQFSGTDALPAERARILERLLRTGDAKLEAIGFSLLDTALGTRISRGVSADFGARRMGFGFFPETGSEIAEWYRLFLNFSARLGQEAGPLGGEVRKRVADKISDLWEFRDLWDDLDRIANLFSAIDGWPEGWLGAKSTAYYHSRTLSPEARARLESLQERLKPSTLVTRIKAQVFGLKNLSLQDIEEDAPGEDFDYSARYLVWHNRARELGRQAAFDDAALDEVLHLIFQQTNYNTGAAFGEGVGAAYPDIPRLFDKLKFAYSGLPQPEQLYALSCLLRAAKARSAEQFERFLDSALSDSIWGPVFVHLQGHFELDGRSLERVLDPVVLERTPIRNYKSLAHSLRILSIDEVRRLVDTVQGKTDGFPSALEMMFWAAYDQDKTTRDRQGMQALTREFLGSVPWKDLERLDHSDAHHLADLVTFAFPNDTEIEAAGAVAKGYIHWRLRTYIHVWKDKNVLGELFKIFGTAILDKLLQSGMFAEDEQLMAALGRSSRYDTAALSSLSPAQVLAWCEVDPDHRFLLIAKSLEFFDRRREAGEGSKSEQWSELGSAILEHAPDRLAIIRIAIDTAHPRGGDGGVADVLRERAELVRALADGTGGPVDLATQQGYEALMASGDAWERMFNRSESNRNVTFE
ncbi:hypothetical protein [Asticcacaulis benevestitus]|nr:hypothetical protein [Asticcacaulis benevestitus]